MKQTHLIALVLALYPASTFAGDSAGNGGGAWVCTDGDGAIVSAELLDLREAALEPYSLTIPRTDTPPEQQFLARLRDLDEHDADLATEILETFNRIRWREVPDGERYQLVPPNDTALRFIRRQRGCSLQGVANYDDRTDVLTYDREIYDAMSNTDKSALMFHEAYYKVLRDSAYGARNSYFARRFTGALYSTEGIRPVSPELGSENATFVCETSRKSENRFRFYVIPLANQGVRLQFTRYANRELFDRSVIDLTLAGEQAESHPGQRADYAELRVRALEGFQTQTRKVQKPRCTWIQRWTNSCQDQFGKEGFDYTFQLRSKFEAPYAFRLLVEDKTSPHDDPQSTQSSHSVFHKPRKHRNAYTQIIQNPYIGKHDSVSCQPM